MDEASLLIALIKYTITGEKPAAELMEELTAERMGQALALAKKHDVVPMVANALFKLGTPQVAQDCQKLIFGAAMRYEQMNYVLESVNGLFERNEIPFIPLKGAVLRRFYPEPWMRTSCDIDVLVHPEDLERAIEALCSKLGYTLKSRDSYDVSLYSPSGVHLELHFALMEKRFEASRYLETVWQNASPVAEGSFRYAMTDDLFYFHQVVHLAKHFATSGCGIRLFMDLWLLNHHKDFNPTGSYKAYLQDVGLVKMEQQIRALSEVWFSGKPQTALTPQMEAYVLGSGIYGTVHNTVATGQLKTGGKGSYAMERIFLSYDRISDYYPILKKKKYLTPAYQVKRWISVIRAGRLKRSAQELSANATLDPELKRSIRDMMTKLELY